MNHALCHSKKFIGVLTTFLLLALVLPADAFRREKEFCSLLGKCGLPYPKAACPDSLRKGVDGVEYDRERCSEAHELVALGLTSDQYIGQKMYGFLGQKYRVTYLVDDSLPVRAAMFEYLLNDIPLAARVVNAFRKSKYTAEYLDGEQKRYWRGNNGGNLAGEANLIAGGIPQKRLVYFGFGIVSVIKWKLKGDVYFDYRYSVMPSGKIKYRLKVLVFPAGAVVNAIMNLSLFKSVVNDKIMEVFNDIVFSANELAKLDYPALEKKANWSAEEKVKLKALLQLK